MKWSLGPILSCADDDQATPHQIYTFTNLEGPSPRTKDAKTPLQLLQLFLTVVILESIVQQTKQFASQKGVSLEFCIEEFMAFIGLNIAMGMLRLRDYWSTDVVLATPWFPSVMSRDRFFTILRFLHVVDSRQQKKKESGYDPLCKIRPLVDHLAAVFPQYYQPSRFLSIDEMMIGTRCGSFNISLKSQPDLV